MIRHIAAAIFGAASLAGAIAWPPLAVVLIPLGGSLLGAAGTRLLGNKAP